MSVDGLKISTEFHTVKLGDILMLRKEIIHPRDNPSGETVFVGLEHIESGSGIRTGCEAVRMEDLEGRKPRFRKGDIVYGYLRPYLNKVWVAEFDGLCSVDQYVYAVIPDLADPEYVAAYFRSPIYLELAPVSAGPGQLPRIRLEEVANIPIPLPPLHEQQRLARILKTKLAAVEMARQAAEDQLAAIAALPSSLLRQAFSGAL